MANQKGVLNSPGASNSKARLDADNLQTLPGKKLGNDIAQSVRSKRSISINVNKVSKI